jgi:hypothetical protein
VAAPRIAESLVHGTPLESTAQIDNLAADETRVYQKRPGEMRFDVGVLGMQMVGSGLSINPGLMGDLVYEAPQFAIGADMRGAWSASHSSSDAGYFSIGPMARYFFSKDDFSPYIGGGLTFTAVSLHPEGSASLSGSGLAPFAELGIEALRTHRARVAVGVRVDFPLFDLESDSSGVTYNGAGQAFAPPKQSGYYAPATFTVSIGW